MHVGPLAKRRFGGPPEFDDGVFTLSFANGGKDDAFARRLDLDGDAAGSSFKLLGCFFTLVFVRALLRLGGPSSKVAGAASSPGNPNEEFRFLFWDEKETGATTEAGGPKKDMIVVTFNASKPTLPYHRSVLYIHRVWNS